VAGQKILGPMRPSQDADDDDDQYLRGEYVGWED
jgi:hypothetical protein